MSCFPITLLVYAALFHRALPQKPIPQMKVGDIVYLPSFHPYPWIFSLAVRAYKQALVTLATLTSIPSSHSFDTHHQFSWNTGNSVLSSILPNPQGQGPLSSALRIAIRLRHQSWLPRFLSSRLSQDSGRRRTDEELSRRAIKVMDLLQHAADLGHLDALLALGKISLVDHSSS